MARDQEMTPASKMSLIKRVSQPSVKTTYSCIILFVLALRPSLVMGYMFVFRGVGLIIHGICY